MCVEPMAPPSWDQSRGLWRHWAGIAMTVVQADRFSMDVRYFRTCLCQLITESAAALCIRADLPGITCTGKRHLDFMSHNLMLFASICSTYILSYISLYLITFSYVVHPIFFYLKPLVHLCLKQPPRGHWHFTHEISRIKKKLKEAMAS